MDPDSLNNHPAAFLISESALEALFLLFSYIVYRMLSITFGPSGLIVALPIFFLSGSFLFISILSLKYRSRIIEWYSRLIMYWIGFLGILFGASIVFVLLGDIGPSIGVVLSTTAIGEISLGLALIIFIYGVWQGQRVEVTSVSVSLPNLPAAWKGKRLVFVSDLHLGSTRNVAFARKVARKIKALPGEIILIGGDFFDGVKCDSRKLVEPFRELSAPLGVYFVSGNHEYIIDTEEFIAAIASVGIHVLHNEIVNIGGIDLIGVDYEDTSTREGFENIMKKILVDSGRPKLLLKHVPDNVDVSERYGMALQLSGHTHNGQIWPLSYCAHLFKEFYYGLHQLATMAIYVSSGVGTRGAPMRIGTKSEIVLITLN